MQIAVECWLWLPTVLGVMEKLIRACFDVYKVRLWYKLFGLEQVLMYDFNYCKVKRPMPLG